MDHDGLRWAWRELREVKSDLGDSALTLAAGIQNLR
jgi:hypothetical protein